MLQNNVMPLKTLQYILKSATEVNAELLKTKMISDFLETMLGILYI